jgi:hypothetical protein
MFFHLIYSQAILKILGNPDSASKFYVCNNFCVTLLQLMTKHYLLSLLLFQRYSDVLIAGPLKFNLFAAKIAAWWITGNSKHIENSKAY